MALSLQDVLSGVDSWNDVPVAQRTVMKNLLDEFELRTGYQVTPDLSQIHQMATEGVNDIRHFEIYVWDHTNMTDAQRQSMPWMGVGMTEDQYDTAVREYTAEYQRLTGKTINPFAQIKNGFITDPVFQQIWDAMRTNTTASEWGLQLSKDKTASAANPGLPQGLDFFQTQQKEANLSGIYRELTGVAAPQDLLDKSVGLDPTAFRAQLVTDPNMLNTYGWLKYGKNYEQFQQYKVEQRQMVGHDLTDQEGVTQLQYTHETTHILGAYQTAQLKPEQQSQQAVQAGAPGTGQSETR